MASIRFDLILLFSLVKKEGQQPPRKKKEGDQKEGDQPSSQP